MQRSYRKGFTLIELLVVIGIILLLVSIVVFGLRHVNATAARHETIAEMNICAGMLKEYQNVNGLKNIEGVSGSGDAAQISPPALQTLIAGSSKQLNLPIYLDLPLPPPPQTPVEAAPPGAPSFIVATDFSSGEAGDFGDRGGSQEPRYVANAVARTQAVMFVMLKDPKNRAMLAVIPPKRILEGPPDITGASTSIPADFSVVLDGWGNPIVYVPRGGMLTYMSPTGTARYYVVRSSGSYIADNKDGTGSLVPPLSANDRPFFASAGQDGLFTDVSEKADNGIDNIYSFQQ